MAHISNMLRHRHDTLTGSAVAASQGGRTWVGCSMCCLDDQGACQNIYMGVRKVADSIVRHALGTCVAQGTCEAESLPHRHTYIADQKISVRRDIV